MNHSKAVYISDLSQCMPTAALSPTHVKYHWQTIPYEAEDISGVMLFAGPESETPPVPLPVEASGWHAVFVGINTNMCGPREAILKVRLSGEQAYCQVEREGTGPNRRVDPLTIDERFWKYADLTGQDIVFAQEVLGGPTPAFVAYVKLVPLSDAEVADIQSDRADQDNKRLIFMNDSFGDYKTLPGHDPRQSIWDWLEPYRDTDFKTLFWCIGCGGDVLTYPSKVGGQVGKGLTSFPRVVDRRVAESIEYFAGRGVDTMRTVVEYAHSMGIQVHSSQRMEAFQWSPPFEDLFTGSLYKEHPEWRCIDIDGREIARMSYAFPGVRDLVLAIFRELATEYDIDGINPIFNRGAPFLLYEQPLVKVFQKESGLDPRQLDERDERYLRYRAGVMTDFMRTLRKEMDEIGAKRGRKIEISTHVLNNEETNRFFALDVPAWVEEGLIDNLIAYPWRDEDIDVEYYGRLVRNTPMKYYAEVMPRRMSPKEYRQRAITYYCAGADGLCFWDTNVRDRYLEEWSMIRRLGHRDQLESLDDGKGDYFRTVKLRSVGGYVLDKYPPHWAY